MHRSLAAALILLIAASFGAAGDVVRLEQKADTIAVTIDGREFTTYRTSKSQAKPFFWPVLAADGATVTRQIDRVDDHPWHKGVWCATDRVNGARHWNEQAKIENALVKVVAAEGNPARFRLANNWLAEDDLPSLRETVEVSIFADRLLVYDAQFTAGEKPVTIDDTKEGLFGIRLADALRGEAGGVIVNAEGRKGESECWGQESKWVDYFGQTDGRTCGVAIFDDPRNFRKSRFHVRDYGLFALSPFGREAYTNGQLTADPLTLAPGESFRLRYGLYVHNGDTTEAKVARVYERFIKGERRPLEK
ncbi:MAG: PmoA family protein [Planctomycetaceae bacterium]